MLPADLGHRLDPGHPGHLQVHQHDVRAGLLVAGDRLAPVTGLGDHLVVLDVAEEVPVGVAHHRLVVHHENPDLAHAPRIRLPVPGCPTHGASDSRPLPDDRRAPDHVPPAGRTDGAAAEWPSRDPPFPGP
ncbi:hypothetical protein SDC9_160011 [bioreactor metagenome]|uniref:Uncharacterized protein n=1 Tax=bioreactor metagenome TaxID=1076179 RepID=A0A645FGS2_9ZZZZ